MGTGRQNTLTCIFSNSGKNWHKKVKKFKPFDCANSTYDQKVQEAMNAHHSNAVLWKAGNSFSTVLQVGCILLWCIEAAFGTQELEIMKHSNLVSLWDRGVSNRLKAVS